MKKNFKIIIIITQFLVFAIFKSFANEPHLYIRFTKIVYSEKEHAFIREVDYSDEYKKNMIKILEYFGYEYLEKNGNLYITIQLDSDIQYLWNLCNKAEDSSWVDRFKP
ncbi:MULTISPECIES: hypothetical protein [unclassified Treponema]|uniref:hypothetical protein n=1 Tax=unclassified Treponema TaxID=2638727 RepID=UPI0020A24516|nr:MULTISPECIES: hypothetical protein [unclassified Treponema]UTC66245.1 hypothetical protein E4O06_09620 [Treponema sp. OMZ 789]UTC68974.1 hypothetical protein E4O01_09750 [Treponema sp. OMZ 790]UTC71701.1 hypothetical protein E4O02_09940 [Treponema sp. OMZ 791]